MPQLATATRTMSVGKCEVNFQIQRLEKHLSLQLTMCFALQKLVAAGVKPRLHILERLFACLRLWNLPGKGTFSTNYGAADSAPRLLGGVVGAPKPPGGGGGS